MKVAIITAAGISARFNKDIPEEDKKLKIIYYEQDPQKTLLAGLVNKCDFADKIVVVGGYKYDDLKTYIETVFDIATKDKIILVKNEHFEDLASGYSFYCGLNGAFGSGDDIEEILFAEGDLDVDEASFRKVVEVGSSVLTYNHEPIYSNKAVVLYRNAEGKYKYAFNSSHGLLKIDDEFSVILNSGQIWKFDDIDVLKNTTDKFGSGSMTGTNLEIIGDYFDNVESDSVSLIGFDRWTNCNTRKDYREIVKNYK